MKEHNKIVFYRLPDMNQTIFKGIGFSLEHNK